MITVVSPTKEEDPARLPAPGPRQRGDNSMHHNPTEPPAAPRDLLAPEKAWARAWTDYLALRP